MDGDTMIRKREDYWGEGGTGSFIYCNEGVKRPSPQTQSPACSMAGNQGQLRIVQVLGVEEVAKVTLDILDKIEDVCLEYLRFTEKS